MKSSGQQNFQMCRACPSLIDENMPINSNNLRTLLPIVRRVLANVPTYMIFDDHDITDDWNLTREWRDQVWRSPGGRRVVAGALAAYWAFQGWGNDPESFDEQFLTVVSAGPGDERFDRVMW